ncbi:hypothetical protein ACHAC9_08095 [Massilia sp. CMS3.1]|uniref:hypothetical protein n=1 Tax=Massilia sp. CMS3.1 TaxID=3373083 RepID=UPI003EE580FC
MGKRQFRAIAVTDNAIGDASMLLYLLDQIAENATLASVSGDVADDTKASHAPWLLLFDMEGAGHDGA